MTNWKTVQPNDPAHLKALISVLGLTEGDESASPNVRDMFEACGHGRKLNPKTTPWCAGGVGWALVQGGLPTSKPIAENLLASSYLKYPGKKFTKNDIIPRGAINVWPRSEGSGHVNVTLKDLGNGRLLCIGCNQGDGHGGGVTIVEYDKSDLRIAVLPIYPGEAVPLPRPKPPVESDTEEHQAEPPALPPAPTPQEPAPETGVLAHLKRRWLEWSSGTGVGGIIAYLTDPWAWAKFFAVLVGCAAGLALLALIVALLLFGVKGTRQYVRSWLPRKDDQ